MEKFNKTIIWETVPLDGVHFLEIKYDTENYIIWVWMRTDRTEPILLYNEKFSHPVDPIDEALKECTKMIAQYDEIVVIKRRN